MARGKKQAVDAGPIEGPWELPDGWRWERLGQCLPLEYGKALSAKNRSSQGSVPVYGSSGAVGYHDEALTSGPTVVVGRKGSAGAVHFCTEACWPIDTAYFVRPRAGMNLRYAFHLLTHLRLSKLDQSTAIPSLSRDNYSDLIVPVAPEDRQQEVAARIDALFAEIEAGEAALAQARSGVETYRKALLKAAVTGELTADWRLANPPQETGEQLLARILSDRRARWQADPKNARKKYTEPTPPDTEGLPELPEGWTWASLQQIAFISGGATVDSKRKPVDAVEVPYLRVANVQRGGLDLSVLKTMTVERAKLRDLLLEAGDILLNEGGDRDKVGRGWIWEGQLDVCAHQNHVFKARPVSPVIEPRLVSMYLNELGRRFFLDESKQTTNLASISMTKVSRAPVAVPPAQEALAIINALADGNDTAIEDAALADMSGTASTLRQSILAAAFRGDLIP